MSNAPASTSLIHADRLLVGDVVLVAGEPHDVIRRERVLVGDRGRRDLTITLRPQDPRNGQVRRIYPNPSHGAIVVGARDPRAIERHPEGTMFGHRYVDPAAFTAWREARTDAELAR